MSGRYSEAHKADNLKGPGDARPTALQIIKDNDREGTMADKVESSNPILPSILNPLGLPRYRSLFWHWH